MLRFVCGGNVSDPALKLSLSTGEDNWWTRSAKRIWLSKNAHSSTPDIIDLEESS